MNKEKIVKIYVLDKVLKKKKVSMLNEIYEKIKGHILNDTL